MCIFKAASSASVHFYECTHASVVWKLKLEKQTAEDIRTYVREYMHVCTYVRTCMNILPLTLFYFCF